MNPTLNNLAQWLMRHRSLALPACAAGALLVLLVPLPPLALDILLAANIALAAVLLVTVLRVGSAMEFSSFPVVLLGATLLRLVLNVATTRLILNAGAGHSYEEAPGAAGQVVWAFSRFVVGGEGGLLAVGVVLFVVISVIQFVVITKGATRISEVHARFVLDAMPGKQMAIDADLNAGLINEAQARQHREGLDQQADFFGAMDGASKFLRGDAVAAILIAAVNILGGLYLGRVHYGWTWSQTVDLFTRLTIGEGLVMQVPALLVSVAAALLVSRGGVRRNLGEDVLRQLGAQPVALGITAVLLGLLMFTGMPKLPLLLIGGSCAGLAWALHRKHAAPAAEEPKSPAQVKPATQNLEEVLAVDPMCLELGYAAVRLVDPARGGDLLGRVTTLRHDIAAEMGLLIPPVRIRDELRLDSHSYVIRIRGQKVAGGKVYPSQMLAIGGEATLSMEGRAGEPPAELADRLSAPHLTGRRVQDPVRGQPAIWISPDQREQAESLGYSVIAPADVLTRHLGEVVRQHASELLSREQVTRMLDSVKARSASLVAEVTQKLRVGQIQKVLQGLLQERVSIRDVDTILEALLEASAHMTDTAALGELVRGSLGRSLSGQYCDSEGRLHAVCLDGDLEETLAACSPPGEGLSVPPELAGKLTRALGQAVGELQSKGEPPVVLCSPQVRLGVKKMLATVAPEAAVLSYSEIDSVKVESFATVRI